MDDTNVRNTVELEFSFNTSASILFSRLSTPSGLSEWFADDVSINGNIYTFSWNKVEQQAELVSMKDNKHIRFRWLKGSPLEEESFFEFRIAQHDLTSELALHVTEGLLDDDDADDAVSLWNYQIGELKRNLGI